VRHWTALLAYAAASVLGAVLLAQLGWQAHASRAAVDSGRVCAAAEERGCLQEENGVLDGPFEFDLRNSDRRWAIEGSSVQLTRHDSELLEARTAVVTGLTYDGTLVALRLDDGTVLRDVNGGSRGVALAWSVALVLLSVAVGFAAVGVRRGRADAEDVQRAWRTALPLAAGAAAYGVGGVVASALGVSLWFAAAVGAVAGGWCAWRLWPRRQAVAPR
jgi:hypothetical protein